MKVCKCQGCYARVSSQDLNGDTSDDTLIFSVEINKYWESGEDVAQQDQHQWNGPGYAA